MHYLMEDATFLFNGQRKKVSMLVRQNEIRYIGYSVPRLNVMKLNVQAFFLTPSFVFYSPTIPKFSFAQFKTYFSQEYLLKGCGCMITDFTIQYQHQFKEELEKKRLELLNSPIDYLFGVKLKAEKLVPELVHICKREAIPVLFIELKNTHELVNIPWGWIKEASFPNNPLFVPCFSVSTKPLRQKHLLGKWCEILQNENIHHLQEPLPINKPLKLAILKKIGLYPKKGILKAGGEINYNLFLKQNKGEHLTSEREEECIPHISVSKGKFVSINQTPVFRPGAGKEIVIYQTGLFK
ncbi:hypothetical protein MUB24_00785 [Lederbergia sp. NSJ-179]|uniref:hypothetical protein n=1 Tax=Lederbergia sp. NSJ-179 TaxID=2931402 RepID=UPI001FD1F808|nr:hypothetical protein [Lederbergia sp. NSJ-179]MCJ7839463.1 hypothetical protein [Lederbergia sp. NSJ-179]